MSEIPEVPERDPIPAPNAIPPSDADNAALDQSGPLLRYAAENVEGLDPSLVQAILRAQEARSDRQWSPAIATAFWVAFNALCFKIQPVTLDGIEAQHRNILDRYWWRPWKFRGKRSIGERMSARYTALIVAFLVGMVLIQLVTWTFSNLSESIEKESTTLQQMSVDLQTKCAALSGRVVPQNDKPHVWSSDETVAFDAIKSSEASVRTKALRVAEASRFLSFLVRFGLEEHPLSVAGKAAADVGDWGLTCDAEIDHASSVIGGASTVSDRAKLVAAILLQFLLPVLLGTIGALAYVLRSTSEQIRNSTLSTTSPTRNLVRVVLGAVMGVIVGLFTDLTTKVSLQPLAIAFLAGYGVEPVFSLFDSIIAKLK